MIDAMLPEEACTKRPYENKLAGFDWADMLILFKKTRRLRSKIIRKWKTEILVEGKLTEEI